MKRTPFAVFTVLLIALVSACAPRLDPDRGAQRFFDKGCEQILGSLEKQKATPDQLSQARAILDRHGQTVPQEIAAMIREHKQLLRTVTAGKDSAALLAQEDKFHTRHIAAVRAIGSMHEELESAVGKPLWAAASADMQQRMADRLRD